MRIINISNISNLFYIAFGILCISVSRNMVKLPLPSEHGVGGNKNADCSAPPQTCIRTSGGACRIYIHSIGWFSGCCCCAKLLLYKWEGFDRWILYWSVIGWAVSMVSLNFIWLVNSRSRHPLNSQWIEFSDYQNLPVLSLKALFSVLISDYLQIPFHLLMQLQITFPRLYFKYRNITTTSLSIDIKLLVFCSGYS